MNERPEIRPALTLSDKLLESTAWLSIIALWVFILGQYRNMPDIIPIHFNAAGQADANGGKGFILTLPIIATLLFIGLTV